MIKQLFYSNLKKITLYTVVLFLVHHFVVSKIFANYYFYYPTYSIYLFLFTITTIIILLTIVINKNYKEKTGFAFLALSVFKMLFSVVFLIPLIKSEMQNKLPDTISFFAAFFVFLTLETIFVIKIINKY